MRETNQRRKGDMKTRIRRAKDWEQDYGWIAMKAEEFVEQELKEQ